LLSIFKKRISGQATEGKKIVDPIKLFTSLIHQDGYGYIRGVQEEFLKLWDQNRSDRDVVGKLNTGAGKTLVGQLMLLSKLNEGIGPVVYLCPDRQLVEQTIEQAALHNIPVIALPDSSSNQGVNFPLEFLNNQAILVCTFERMFNGKSIFGVEGFGYRPIQSIGTLVIDDAHSCIKKARKQATIS